MWRKPCGFKSRLEHFPIRAHGIAASAHHHLIPFTWSHCEDDTPYWPFTASFAGAKLAVKGQLWGVVFAVGPGEGDQVVMR